MKNSVLSKKKWTNRTKKHKHKLESSDTVFKNSLSDCKDISSESGSFTRSIKKKYRKNKRQSGLLVSSRKKSIHRTVHSKNNCNKNILTKKNKFEDFKFHQFVLEEMEMIVSCKNDEGKNGLLPL